ncbi:MAG: ParB/RepB/Spo0J family partition protein [Clostridia bacterium]|nr:ParB/RepB/Spo0J family partition protein [Clostridia bacterium]
MILSFRKTGKIVEIPLVQIRPCRTQARQYYDVESLKALADSIRMNGILQPVTVRKVSALEYELIAGERRVRAAALCGYTRIPCIILTCTDNQAEVLSLEENLQRTNLNCFEEAQGIRQWMRHAQLNPQEAASYLGQQPETLSHKMELLKADDEEKQLMVKAHFTEKHIHAVLRVQDKTDRRIVMSEIIEGSMNVSQSEQYVSDYLENTAREKRRLQRKKGWLKDIRMFHNTIDKAVAALRVSGLAAETIQYDTGDSIEYVIRIPKTRQRMADCQEMTA